MTDSLRIQFGYISLVYFGLLILVILSTVLINHGIFINRRDFSDYFSLPFIHFFSKIQFLQQNSSYYMLGPSVRLQGYKNYEDTICVLEDTETATVTSHYQIRQTGRNVVIAASTLHMHQVTWVFKGREEGVGVEMVVREGF